MKMFVCFLLSLCLSASLFAQEEPAAPKLPQEELDKLVAPIALYPDSLVALILPSSTTPSDVVLAARYLAVGGVLAAIDNQPWGDSVKSLAHFPAVVKWMDENLAWTRQMGDVFESQPADVMNTIQRLRAQARAAGLLTDTPQQKIVTQDEEICIVPASPDIIYVPRYDPEILWMRRSYCGYGPFMTFGVGFGIGSWLYYDCDWPRRDIWVHQRHPGWVYHPGWRRPVNEVHVVVGAPWHPDPRRMHPGRPMHQPPRPVVRPRGMDEPHRDFRGRNEHPTTPPSSRSGHPIAPAPVRGASMPQQPTVSPSPTPNHPSSVGQQQSPREHRHRQRERENRTAPQQPHPPSHAPVMSAAPLPSPLAPVPGVRSSGSTRGVAPVVPGLGRATNPSHTAKSSDKGDDNKRHGRHGR